MQYGAPDETSPNGWRALCQWDGNRRREGTGKPCERTGVRLRESASYLVLPWVLSYGRMCKVTGSKNGRRRPVWRASRRSELCVVVVLVSMLVEVACLRGGDLVGWLAPKINLKVGRYVQFKR